MMQTIKCNLSQIYNDSSNSNTYVTGTVVSTGKTYDMMVDIYNIKQICRDENNRRYVTTVDNLFDAEYLILANIEDIDDNTVLISNVHIIDIEYN